MADLIDMLTRTKLLVADGAAGTMLQQAGLPRGMAPERWNLENPAEIIKLHASYVAAGAQVILTNTFGGSRLRLQKDHLDEQVYEVNYVAAQLAREATGAKVVVLGDIGPSGMMMKPYGKLEYSQAVEVFREQALALVEGGVDGIIIETMSDLNEARAALEGARQSTGLPVVVTMSFDTHGRTMMGVKPEDFAETFSQLDVQVIGANCGRSLSETLTAVEAIHRAAPLATLMAKPNAGLPRRETLEKGKASEIVYDVTPEVVGEYALKFATVGVKIFGACCGSNPAHIQAIATAFKGL